MGSGEHSRPNRAPVYLSYREAVKGIASQGFSAFYKGALPLAGMKGMAFGLKLYCFTLFEYFYHFRREEPSFKRLFSYYFYTSMAIGRPRADSRVDRLTPRPGGPASERDLLDPSHFGRQK